MEAGDTPRHTVVLDWDGTLVPAQWPERPTTFMPGAIPALQAMHKAGYKLLVFSARLSPFDPFTSRRRDPSVLASEYQYVRDMLDRAGLAYVDIWRQEGKPGGSIYVDDKAVRYTGRPGSWRAVTEKIFALLGAEEPFFPEFNQEVAETP